MSNSSAPFDSTKVSFPANGWGRNRQLPWGTAPAKSPLFTCAEKDRHIANSGKKYQNSEYHSLPIGLRKEKAFLADKVHEDPHNLKLALCIVSGEIEYAYCGPRCAAGKSGFCNFILVLMMKVCKYSLYECKDVRDLKDEEDENPTNMCTDN